jgi:hypothetical protein
VVIEIVLVADVVTTKNWQPNSLGRTILVVEIRADQFVFSRQMSMGQIE